MKSSLQRFPRELEKLLEERDMPASSTRTYEIEVEDVEYLRHGEKPLLAQSSLAMGIDVRSYIAALNNK
jgi:hypothetical protein